MTNPGPLPDVWPSAETPTWTIWERPARGPVVRLIAVGDVGLSGRVQRTAERLGYAALWEEIAPLLRTADGVFGNLETPLVPPQLRPGLFAADPQAAAALADAGFTILHGANNHIYDYGVPGIAATVDALRAAGLAALGLGVTPAEAAAPALVAHNGVRLAWLGCGEALEPPAETRPYFQALQPAELLEAVRRVRPTVDAVIVSIHAGVMYAQYPRPDHKALAEALTAAGATLVLFHNPHVLQGVACGPQGAICYSLGNWLFDVEEGHVAGREAADEPREGALFWFELDADGVCRACAMPTWITDECRVVWATGARGQAIVARLQRLSAELETDYTARFWRQRSERTTGLLLRAAWLHLRRGHWRELGIMARRLRPYHLRMLAYRLWPKR